MDENYLTGLETKVIGRRVIHYDKVTSTNDLAWLEIARGAQEGTVIVANEQFKGRGRYGREWFSPAQKGIWCSIIANIAQFPEDMFMLMAIGAIASVEMLQVRYKLPATIRWPNDVMINNKKLAGIIVESKYINTSPNAAVIGIGMNINITEPEIPDELKNITTSIIIEQNKTTELEIKPIISNLIYAVDRWYQKISAKDTQSINDAWKKHSSVINKKVTIQIKNSSLEGKLVNLDIYKGIALEDKDGNVAWFRGETVEMLRPHDKSA